MNCPHCNAAVPRGWIKCPQCNQTVQQAEDERQRYCFCAECGERVPTQFAVCPKCGSMLVNDKNASMKVSNLQTKGSVIREYIVAAFVVISVLLLLLLSVFRYGVVWLIGEPR